jgi:hypothetical protein
MSLTVSLSNPRSGGMLAPADVVDGFHQLGLSDFASDCVVDALRRHVESCVMSSGSTSLPYTQLLLDIVGAEALPSLSPTDFALQM